MKQEGWLHTISTKHHPYLRESFYREDAKSLEKWGESLGLNLVVHSSKQIYSGTPTKPEVKVDMEQQSVIDGLVEDCATLQAKVKMLEQECENNGLALNEEARRHIAEEEAMQAENERMRKDKDGFVSYWF